MSKAQAISLHIIVQQHLPPEANEWSHDKIVDELSRLTHVRLDRQQINVIDNMELLGPNVTNLYLQHNLIETIENLDCLVNLRFLTLASNRIRHIAGLCHLSQLSFLDLSDNNIGDLNTDELPTTLVILNLKGNQCTEVPKYRTRVRRHLPRLRQLDGESVCEVDNTEVDELGCLDIQTHRTQTHQSDSDSFYEMTSDILQRSQVRLEDKLSEHRARMQLLDDMRVSMTTPHTPSTPGSRSTYTPDSTR